MMAQQYLNRVWTIVAQWITQMNVSSIARRIVLCLLIIVLAFSLFMLSTLALHISIFGILHSSIQSAAQLFNKIPYGEPYP